MYIEHEIEITLRLCFLPNCRRWQKKLWNFLPVPLLLPELLNDRNAIDRTAAVAGNVFGGESFDQGCGALNLVNVAEPLKIGRLILGVDDSSPNEVRLIPRLPSSWSSCIAENWPILTPNGLVRADIRFERKNDKMNFNIDVKEAGYIPYLRVRLPESSSYIWHEYKNVIKAEVS